jgi:hypothetical protein
MMMNFSDGIDIVIFTNGFGNRSFYFQMNKNNTAYAGPNVPNGKTPRVEPYSFTWNGTREDLFNNSRGSGSGYGCAKDRVFCAKLIQYDGWEIKDDYPW